MFLERLASTYKSARVTAHKSNTDVRTAARILFHKEIDRFLYYEHKYSELVETTEDSPIVFQAVFLTQSTRKKKGMVEK